MIRMLLIWFAATTTCAASKTRVTALSILPCTKTFLDTQLLLQTKIGSIRQQQLCTFQSSLTRYRSFKGRNYKNTQQINLRSNHEQIYVAGHCNWNRYLSYRHRTTVQLQVQQMGVNSNDDHFVNDNDNTNIVSSMRIENNINTLRRSKRQRTSKSALDDGSNNSRSPGSHNRTKTVMKTTKRKDVLPIAPRSSYDLEMSSINISEFQHIASIDADCCISMNEKTTVTTANNTSNPTTTVSFLSPDLSRTAQIVTPDHVNSNSNQVPDWVSSSSSPVRRPNRSLSFVDDIPVSTRDIDDGYVDLCIPPSEFRPSASLTTGQCFHWRAVSTTSSSSDSFDTDNDNEKYQSTTQDEQIPKQQQQQSAWGIHNASEWVGILRVASPTLSTSSSSTTNDDEIMSISSIVVSIRETPGTVLYKTLYAPSHVNVSNHLLSYIHMVPATTDSLVHDENLNNVSLRALYSEWSEQCPRLKQIASCIPGVRVLNQDPWECFVSFLCSSNNNIPRITKMLQSIREEYGTEIPVHTNTESGWGQRFFTFPSLQHLMTHATELDLRNKCGMGYRARYLIESMKLLHSLGGEQYLHQLKYNMSDPIKVQDELLQFTGIGRKVADCIALFSLNQYNAIPVDVHVWNIARRDYDSSLIRNTISMTPTVYARVGNVFRQRFPNKSGWAHSLLFVAELPSFRPVLPTNLIQEMDRFKLAEKKRKGT